LIIGAEQLQYTVLDVDCIEFSGSCVPCSFRNPSAENVDMMMMMMMMMTDDYRVVLLNIVTD